MNPDIKSRWLAALRSDEYKQGQYHLRQFDPRGSASYCCLGVLCEIAVEDGVVARRDGDFEDDYGLSWYEAPSDDMSEVVLPQAVVEWAGLTDINPTIDNIEISVYNDERGYGFSDIADLIEEYL